MVGKLEKVMVCSPATAGWNRPERVAAWRELGFHHAPDFALAQSQHEVLYRELENAAAEVLELPPAHELSLDAVYTHDASLTTDFGLIVMRPGKANRVPEGQNHAGSPVGQANPSPDRQWSGHSHARDDHCAGHNRGRRYRLARSNDSLDRPRISHKQRG